MPHKVSIHGIVGLGALGSALQQFIPKDAATPAAVIFAVKAFDLESALLEQADKWPANLPFVTMSNGYIWPVIATILPRLGQRPIRIGMTTLGSTLKQDGSVSVFADGSMTAWGHWPNPTMPLIPPRQAELDLINCFPSGSWHDDIRPLIRQKWIINVVINSVAAAHKLPKNGALKAFQNEIDNVLDEALALAEIIWADLPWNGHERDAFSKKIWTVIDATAGNQNSMVRDISLGRKTESDYLAGLAADFEGFTILKSLHKTIQKQS